MKLTAVAPILSSIYSNISNHSVGKTLASFLNGALSKYAGVKQPPLTPFTATLLVGGLTLATVGTLFYAVFSSSRTPPAPPQKDPKHENTLVTTPQPEPENEPPAAPNTTTENALTKALVEEDLPVSPKQESPESETATKPLKENTPPNSPKHHVVDPLSTPVDRFIKENYVSGEVVQQIIDSDELVDNLIKRNKLNHFISTKKVKVETEKVPLIFFALKDSCPLERFIKIADAVTQIPLSEFNFLRITQVPTNLLEKN